MAGALLLAALAAGAVVMLVRGRARRVDVRVAEDLAEAPALRGPERRALYMGGTGPYPRSSSNGRVTLTRTRLAFRSMIGADVIVPLEEIIDARSEIKGWKTRPVPRRPHLEVVTAAGKLAIDVRDCAAWVDALHSQLRAAETPGAAAARPSRAGDTPPPGSPAR